tara:strand:+ start:189 stop:449 length:261 start_codon:yes stop_codon:yes gene_type:complete
MSAGGLPQRTHLAEVINMNKDKLQINRTHDTARRVFEELYFLKQTAKPINDRIKDLTHFLNTLYDRLLEAGIKDYSIEDMLGRDEE